MGCFRSTPGRCARASNAAAPSLHSNQPLSTTTQRRNAMSHPACTTRSTTSNSPRPASRRREESSIAPSSVGFSRIGVQTTSMPARRTPALLWASGGRAGTDPAKLCAAYRALLGRFEGNRSGNRRRRRQHRCTNLRVSRRAALPLLRRSSVTSWPSGQNR